eukprot:1159028-Pelagomonas_calceolata.AAC.4
MLRGCCEGAARCCITARACQTESLPAGSDQAQDDATSCKGTRDNIKLQQHVCNSEAIHDVWIQPPPSSHRISQV